MVVFPRLWCNDNMKFISDPRLNGNLKREYSIPLPYWQKPPVSDHSKQTMHTIETKQAPINENKETNVDSEHPIGESVNNPSRRLAYRFLTLQYHEIVEIANKLKLLSDGDDGLRDFELFRKIIERAKDGKLLAELWEAVEKEHGNDDPTNNPF